MFKTGRFQIDHYMAETYNELTANKAEIPISLLESVRPHIIGIGKVKAARSVTPFKTPLAM